MTSSADEPASSSISPWQWLRRPGVAGARWILATVFLLLAILMVVAGSRLGWESCSTRTTRRAATVETIRTCDPLGATDALVVMGLGLVLLIPDLDELEVAGVVTLRRVVRRQAETQERLEGLVTSLSTIVTQRMSVQNINYLTTIEENRRRIEQVAPLLEEGGPPTAESLEDLLRRALPAGDPTALLEEIDRRLTTLTLMRESDDIGLPEEQLRQLRRWSELLDPQIKFVQEEAARVSVGSESSPKAVADIAEIGRQLLDRLEQSLTSAALRAERKQSSS